MVPNTIPIYNLIMVTNLNKVSILTNPVVFNTIPMSNCSMVSKLTMVPKLRILLYRAIRQVSELGWLTYI